MTLELLEGLPNYGRDPETGDIWRLPSGARFVTKNGKEATRTVKLRKMKKCFKGQVRAGGCTWTRRQIAEMPSAGKVEINLSE